ncbi:MAG: hypothetical protein Q9166_004703 [cf. Caloplaca sp. 2 TL-2023]
MPTPAPRSTLVNAEWSSVDQFRNTTFVTSDQKGIRQVADDAEAFTKLDEAIMKQAMVHFLCYNHLPESSISAILNTADTDTKEYSKNRNVLRAKAKKWQGQMFSRVNVDTWFGPYVTNQVTAHKAKAHTAKLDVEYWKMQPALGAPR